MHLKVWWYDLWQAALGYSLHTSFSEVSVTIAVLLSTLISVSFQSRKHNKSLLSLENSGPGLHNIKTVITIGA